MMKKFILLSTIVFLTFSCEKREEKLTIEQPQTNEIREVSDEEINEFNLIVEAIIHQNNLDVLKSDKDSKGLIIDYLYRIKVNKNTTNSDNFRRPKSTEIFYSELIGNTFENTVYFTSVDSLYIMQQNAYRDSIKIAASILEKVNTKENVKDKLKNNSDLYFSEYEISIPILSKDRQTAYVELSHFCGALCGNGSVLILKKIEGKWKVVEDIFTWIS